MGKISVCIATYNGELYIKDQIKSILNQSYEVDEIIVSDDGSTDQTLDILKEISSDKIKIVRNNKKGIISNFENAINFSTGDYIFLADQDDIWLQDKVEIVMKDLKEYDLVVHNAKILNKNLQTGRELFEIYNSKRGILKNILKNTYMGCCMAFRRNIFGEKIVIPKNVYMHDIWIGLIAELYGKVKFNNKVLLLYRRHNNNASETASRSKRKLKDKFFIRVQLIKELFLFILENGGIRKIKK